MIIEIAEVEGNVPSSALYRCALERVEVRKFNERGPESPTELIDLDVGKMTGKQLSHRPDVTKRAGLDSAFGIRKGTRLA